MPTKMDKISEEVKKNFLVNTDDTGRFIVKSLKTGKTYYVEPIDVDCGHPRTFWGDLNPVTKKMEGDYGSKHKGSIKASESLITEENGFDNITILAPGYSPLEYIEKLEKEQESQ